MPGKTEVIVAGEINEFTAMPVNGAAANAVARFKIRDRDPSARNARDAALQFAVTRKTFNETVARARLFRAALQPVSDVVQNPTPQPAQNATPEKATSNSL